MAIRDPGTNYTFELVEARATLAASAATSDTVDTSNHGATSFLINIDTVGTGGTLTPKLQYSDDDSSWTDEPSNDNAGNDATIIYAAVGLFVLNNPNPRARYVRVHATAAVDTIGYSVISVKGPKRFVDA